MRHNEYDGLLDEWKVRLIVSRARRLGFRPDQIDDAMQEMVLDLLAFRFDPAKANGASESTALTAVIDKRLRTIRRAWRRYQQHVARLKVARGVDEARDRWPEPVEDETALLVLDVRAVVAHLSPRQRHLCQALLEGSRRAVSRGRRCGWGTVCQEIEGIRRRFTAAGLEEYLAR